MPLATYYVIFSWYYLRDFRVYLEEGFSDETVADLKKRGYEVEALPAPPPTLVSQR